MDEDVFRVFGSGAARALLRLFDRGSRDKRIPEPRSLSSYCLCSFPVECQERDEGISGACAGMEIGCVFEIHL